MPTRRRTSRPYLLDAILLAFVVTGLSLGPRMIDARAALLWTRYFAAQPGPVARPIDAGRQAGRAAARAIDRAAPLPMAAEAARNALTFGQTLMPLQPPAALALYTEVRTALDRARASRVRGLGLGALAAEARGLEDSARAAVDASTTKP